MSTTQASMARSSEALHTRMRNDAKVYAVLQGARRPMTIAEISQQIPDVVEKTIRRAVKSLLSTSHIVEAGRDNNAKLYALVGNAGTGNDDKLIPLGNGMVTVEQFVRVMADPKGNPFGSRLKIDPLSEEFENILRTRMLYAIVTSGDPGYRNQLDKVQEMLLRAAGEMERLTGIVRNFANSPVWYDQYRDAIALAMRELEKTDPELCALTRDFVKSGASDR